MTGIDLIATLIVIFLFFLRHVAVYKDPNKINYLPIVLALGIIGSLLHFGLHASPENEIFVIKESFLLVAVSVLLSSIMSVMTQSAKASNQEDFRQQISSFADDVDLFKTSLNALATRVEHLTLMEDTTHEQLRTIFKEEIEALNVIQSNQKLFVSKIETLLAKQHVAMEKFEDFTLTELPGLDNIVHRHIDLLRIAEQDHFNQLKTATRSSCDEQKHVQAQLQEIARFLQQTLSKPLPQNTVNIINRELEKIIHDFSRQIQGIGSKSELMVTTLLENDAILKGSREQSELIMQQMVLSTKQMREITTQAKELSESLKPLNRLFEAAELMAREVISAKGKLTELIVMLESYDRQDNAALRNTIDTLIHEMRSQSDSHTRLNDHDAKNMQELSHKVRLHQSYTLDNQE